MKILYSPQFSKDKIKYEFKDETIIVEYNKVKDVFDLSILNIGDEIVNIDTNLSINPIISAKRDLDGELYVELVYYHGIDATEDERFPDWKVV